MSTREVSGDEIIGVWLRREFKGNWERIKPVLDIYLPDLEKSEAKRIVDSSNYQKDHENRLRFMFLYAYRLPLLLPLWKASWCEKKIIEKEFKELRVIKDQEWVDLSQGTGKLSTVAQQVFENPNCKGIAEGISNIERAGVSNKDLFLLESNDSPFNTILEGNKTAVALYIKFFLKKELTYEPFKVYLGHLRNKSVWQW